MRLGRVIAVVVCVTVLVAAGAIALAVTGGSSRAGARVRELAGAGEVALVPSHNAGVGGWCVVRLNSGDGGDAGGGGECRASKWSTSRGPFQGPIITETGNPFIVVRTGSTWVMKGIALVTAPVAAVSFPGYKRIATHASALLPDHLRGAVVEQRGSSSKQLGRGSFPSGHLIAWSRSGKSIPQTFAKGRPLAFRVPVRSWSNGAPAQRGVCEINARGVVGLELRSGGIISEVEPHTDVLGREFLNCAHSYYLLNVPNGKWPLDVYVLLDAAHPGTTPAPLPGMRPLAGHSGVFIGPGPESGELARRIPGGWLVVTAGEGVSQRLRVLEHLHATVTLRGH